MIKPGDKVWYHHPLANRVAGVLVSPVDTDGFARIRVATVDQETRKIVALVIIVRPKLLSRRSAYCSDEALLKG